MIASFYFNLSFVAFVTLSFVAAQPPDPDKYWVVRNRYLLISFFDLEILKKERERKKKKREVGRGGISVYPSLTSLTLRY